MAGIKVGINGFGRIGRVVFRLGHENFDFVGINNLGSIETVAHLLQYDSTHGRFKGEVRTEGDSKLVVNGKTIPFSSTKNPAEIPWKSWGADIAMECTGAFKTKEDFMKHVDAGAKRVIVSAPAPGADHTLVMGVNDSTYDPGQHRVVSNASCTTNCLAPIAKVLHERFGIEHAVMTTIHSYTNDQQLLDAPHKDLRRARAGALSMIPTTTGAAKAVGMVLPDLDGRIDGLAIRVPTPNVSLVDLSFTSSKDLSVEEMNAAMIEAAEGPLNGILQVSRAELVSCDFNGNPASSVADLTTTMVIGKRMAKVMAWYDNETGFSSRMLDLAQFMAKKGL